MLSTTLLIASLSTLVLGAPTVYNPKLHEPHTDIPTGLSPPSTAPSDTPLQLCISLVQCNFTALEERLYDVSTPSSANSGKRLSKEEVRLSCRVALPSLLIQPYSLSPTGRTTRQL